ncbi:histidine--tRNA ligase [Quisquiliibacterium transsilvanicum]|uniref:Histidine--tRNA ligase n=1 Tax=Quisquiliibacterium transsilvanicum TaxID=1549638 RepID=A0A7W8M733_9BURK|nr:histidine--tRNA ligase [Quisquiliibacterium transsilvanicum]MBB5270162.1 histidyl-tRNA synthetase [Quisquiliibacterium transsilvanicum]
MSKTDKIQGVRGMNDVLPADEAYWRRLEDVVADSMRGYGYQRIRTPIVEQTRLFVRGIGEVTDIVEKEMYSFTDALNGEQLTLRPECTAGVVRAAIEHNLTYDGPRRLWYSGPMFRHERPQKGRYRQFHQVGAEAMGFTGPDADAEVILLCQRLWDDLGLVGVQLEINSLGQAHERRAHRDALIAYLEANAGQLDEDARRRLHSNPLRILDTKNPAMQALVEGAPKLIGFLGEESLAHFDGLQALLRAQNLPYRINPRLVRGLDYYNLSVFEWVVDGLTICGGGRYDPLVEMLGGKPTPACGFALGVERVIELMRRAEPELAESLCDVYVVHQGAQAGVAALQAAERLRDSGLDVVMHCGGGSFKSQFRKADASGAFAAVVLGDDEVAAGEATVKWLRADDGAAGSGQQQRVPLERVAEVIIGFVQDEG